MLQLVTSMQLDVDRLDPDATSIYDIRPTPYAVDRLDADDVTSIFHKTYDSRLTEEATIRAMGLAADYDDLEATSIYIRTSPVAVDLDAWRRQIREARRDIAGLRAALVSGWDVGPKLAYEERRLAALEEA